ncbi:hypothetical protein C0992_006381 [Termitomyces sp. T32_za158]|nr:hypothetical protein C0992_006381 [Termitomyces sp. T32_za158]
MPPRRSSRSTRASVEPTEAASLPSKRKRGQTAETEAEQQTEVAKPPSRARRSTSTQPVTTTERRRTSTRSRGSLPDVTETDDVEETESLPPVKKVRPSLELQEDKGSELDEEKPRARRTASLAKRGKPLSAGRKPPSSTRSGRSSRAAPVPATEEEDSEEEDRPEEDARPKIEDNDVMQTSADEPPPKPKSRKTVASKKVTQPSQSQKVASPIAEAYQKSDNGQTQVGAREEASGHDTPEVQADATIQEEEEEETSLFDPPPMPVPSSLPQAIPEEPAGPKPRLVIHKMALVNFKSYAGRQEIGPFHKSFSSIVGPNGSGKSNTIDALLFVFGYRASKMRQGKLSELIHNSARYPHLDECSVEVHFREIIDLGRLGSLGTIPDKYDIAVSTAAPALHHMIVDRVEQGQACIEYLRSQNIGRASFMVLEKLTSSNSMAKIATPENVPRLFDLIQPKDPKFAPAFYKAVGNTLVAEDMDQANRIAYGARRWKVVTLSGQLIETSGTMSGGGSQPARGAMSSKLATDAVSPQVLRKYEQESQDASQQLDQALKELRIAEEELDRLRNSGPQIDLAFQKLGLDIENSKHRIAEAEKRVQHVKYDTTIQSNTAGFQEAEAELEELDSTLEELTTYVTQLRAKVEDAQDAANSSKEDLDNLKAEVDTKDQEIAEFRKKELEIKQQLGDAEKEKAENYKTIDYWRTEHDKLRLEAIDDDDEDENSVENPDVSNAAEQPEVEAQGEDEVKQEPEESRPTKSRTKDKASSQELYVYRPEELARLKKRDLVVDEQVLDEKVKNAKPDLSVLKEYRKREEEFLNRAKDLDSVTAERDAQKQKYDGLRKQRLDEFMSGFNTISLKLKEMYQMITLGGNAELELPTPLYFMDEIDAALDFRNVSIVANYIKDRTKNAQFIIISLRNDMFELSHRLIGIYKTANATRSISIDNHVLIAPPVKA